MQRRGQDFFWRWGWAENVSTQSRFEFKVSHKFNILWCYRWRGFILDFGSCAAIQICICIVTFIDHNNNFFIFFLSFFFWGEGYIPPANWYTKVFENFIFNILYLNIPKNKYTILYLMIFSEFDLMKTFTDKSYCYITYYVGILSLSTKSSF